jgi:hypothetical protein
MLTYAAPYWIDDVSIRDSVNASAPTLANKAKRSRHYFPRLLETYVLVLVSTRLDMLRTRCYQFVIVFIERRYNRNKGARRAADVC